MSGQVSCGGILQQRWIVLPILNPKQNLQSGVKQVYLSVSVHFFLKPRFNTTIHYILFRLGTPAQISNGTQGSQDGDPCGEGLYETFNPVCYILVYLVPSYSFSKKESGCQKSLVDRFISRKKIPDNGIRRSTLFFFLLSVGITFSPVHPFLTVCLNLPVEIE